MNLYLISQKENNDYDTFDSAVVAAETSEEAQNMHPYGGDSLRNEDWDYTWCQSEFVKVTLIGTAKDGTKKGVILASFNAG